MNINESAENYLETILMLSKELPVVRSVDIANELGFKKSSVSVAMKNLREKNHIVVDDSGFITLTPSGREIAEMIYERHELLSSWLVRLGVPKEIAAEDACKMEHVLSKESFEAIKQIANEHISWENIWEHQKAEWAGSHPPLSAFFYCLFFYDSLQMSLASADKFIYQ